MRPSDCRSSSSGCECGAESAAQVGPQYMLSTRSEHRDCGVAAAEGGTAVADDEAATTKGGAAATERETADEAAGNQPTAECGTKPEQGGADSMANAVSVSDENDGTAEQAGRLQCLTVFREEDEPPDWRRMQRGNAAKCLSSNNILQGRTNSGSRDAWR